MLKRLISFLLSWALVALPLSAKEDKKETDRLDNCGTVLREIMDIPDDIPTDLIDKAECIIVYPSVLKAAFVFGGSYGRGAMVCRSGKTFKGPWGAPAMYVLEGGSFGLQLGGESTDVVLLIMNDRGVDALLDAVHGRPNWIYHNWLNHPSYDLFWQRLIPSGLGACQPSPNFGHRGSPQRHTAFLSSLAADT